MTYTTLPVLAKPTKEIRDYLAAVQQGENSQFVVERGQHWIVSNRRDLSTKSFPTKVDALTYASTVAARHHGRIFIFDTAGQLLERR